MRRVLGSLWMVVGCVVLLLGLGTGPLKAQKNDGLTTMSHDALELVKVLTAQERDWNDGNLDGFLAGYKHGSDTVFVGLSVQHGWDEMAARYRASYPNRDAMGVLSFSDLEPRVLDAQFAVMTGKYSLERNRKAGGPARGVFSLIFEKTDAGWKILVDHTS